MSGDQSSFAINAQMVLSACKLSVGQEFLLVQKVKNPLLFFMGSVVRAFK
jgi:hypothetical protein